MISGFVAVTGNEILNLTNELKKLRQLGTDYFRFPVSFVEKNQRGRIENAKESMRPLWFFHIYILSSATTALSTLCQGRLYPHICIYIYTYIYFFFPESTVTNPAIWLVLYPISIFLSLPTGNGNAIVSRRVYPYFHYHFP